MLINTVCLYLGNRNEDNIDEIGFYEKNEDDEDENDDAIERYDEDEDDYATEDDHFENISDEDNASYLVDEVKELENEAIFHNPQVQLRRSSRISAKNLDNRMSWK